MIIRNLIVGTPREILNHVQELQLVDDVSCPLLDQITTSVNYANPSMYWVRNPNTGDLVKFFAYVKFDLEDKAFTEGEWI